MTLNNIAISSVWGLTFYLLPLMGGVVVLLNQPLQCSEILLRKTAYMGVKTLPENYIPAVPVFFFIVLLS